MTGTTVGGQAADGQAAGGSVGGASASAPPQHQQRRSGSAERHPRLLLRPRSAGAATPDETTRVTMSEMGGLRAAEREPGAPRPASGGAALASTRSEHAAAAPRRHQSVPRPTQAAGPSEKMHLVGFRAWLKSPPEGCDGGDGGREGRGEERTRAAGRRRGSAPAASTHSARQLQLLDEEGDHAARGTWREREPMPCSTRSRWLFEKRAGMAPSSMRH